MGTFIPACTVQGLAHRRQAPQAEPSCGLDCSALDSYHNYIRYYLVSALHAYPYYYYYYYYYYY